MVVEVREDEEEASEGQNNEQMVGLWKSGQIAMLGLEFHTNAVRPKLLALKDDDLHMFYVKRLDLTNSHDLCELTRLMMSFIICMKYLSSPLICLK